MSRTLPAALSFLIAVLALAACRPAPDPRRTTGAAERLLLSVERALGGTEAIRSVTSLTSVARGTGPRGEFLVEIVSRPGQAVRLDRRVQGHPQLEALVTPGGGWRFEGTEAIPLPGLTRERIWDTDVHGRILSLSTWITDPGPVAEVVFAGTTCLEFSGTDRLGRPASVLVDGRTALPAGLRWWTPDHGSDEPTVIELADWRRVGPVMLPHRTVTTGGEGLTRATYVTVAVNRMVDELLAPPPAGGD